MIRPDIYPRVLAHRLIFGVVAQNQTTDRLFETPVMMSLALPDRQFVRLLVLTVLRHYLRLEAGVTFFLKRPLPAKRKDVLLALMIGLAELYYLKTPPHAAVDTTVELVKALKQQPFVALTNAVLRTCVRQKDRLPDLLAVAPAVPDWLAHSWIQAYGETETDKIIRAMGVEPPLDITVPENAEMWAEKLGGSVFFPHTVRLPSGGLVRDKAGYQEGAWWVQNAAAAVPACLFTALKGLCVADLCAAPGGKTAQLAAAGAFVDAFDISKKRLNRLMENMKRLKLESRVKTICADVAVKPDGGAIYDAVLLDAPCSATGTLARHPDLIFHRGPDDVRRLAELQKTLLDKAAGMTRLGGELVYSVCSLQPEEGEEQIHAFLDRFPMFRVIIPTPDFLKPYHTPEHFIRLTPAQGTDGFFAALLQRES